MNIGERIKARRKELKMSMQKVADIAGVTKSYICEIEKGSRQNITIKSLLCLADALDVTGEYFIGTNKSSASAQDNAFFQKYLSSRIDIKDRIRRVVREMLR